MSDTRRTRGALATLLADNTSGDISAQDMRDFLVSSLDPFGPIVAINGATTATINQRHRCVDAGSPADYTLTLPAVSGNDEQLLEVIIDRAMTKFVTLDGNSSETIDGATTRLMWAGETALLQVINGEWKKIAGKNVPMSVTASISSNPTVANSTETKMVLDTFSSGISALFDSGNAKLLVKRAGILFISGQLTLENISAASNNTQIIVKRNGATSNTFNFPYAPSGAYPAPTISQSLAVAAADYLELYAYQVSGVSQNVYPAAAYLGFTELSSW